MSKIVIASFDIECMSESGNFPQASNDEDKIIQIGTVFSYYGESEPFYKNLISLGGCTKIKGLEDVRLYKSENKVFYTATSQNYSYTDSIRIIQGEYDEILNTFTNNACLIPPTETYCEKNWIALEDNFIYKWHPLEIGKVIKNKLEILLTLDTPEFFKYYRGSSNVVKYKNYYWMVTHGIKNCTPRKYFHQIVILNENFSLKKYTIPFYFDKLAIEYCLGLVILNDIAYMTVSRNDSNPIIIKIAIDKLNQYFY
jgi:hypothetical protein